MPGARPGAGGARRGLGSELTGLTGPCPSHGHAGGSPLPCLEGEPPSAHRGWSADTGLPRRREARGRGPGLGLRCDTAPHPPVPVVALVRSSEAAPLPLGRGREGTPVGNSGCSQDSFSPSLPLLGTPPASCPVEANSPSTQHLGNFSHVFASLDNTRKYKKSIVTRSPPPPTVTPFILVFFQPISVSHFLKLDGPRHEGIHVLF